MLEGFSLTRRLQSSETAVRPRYAPLPQGHTLYAVGDIHGRVDLLRRLHRCIDLDTMKHGNRAVEIYLGDYIDRGPQSAEVIESLLSRARIADIICLKGNHEAIIEKALQGSISFEQWRSIGGRETLLSYGLDPSRIRHLTHEDLGGVLHDIIPDRHKEFLRSLHLSFEFETYLFVHAGVRPYVSLAEQQPEDILWIRQEFLDFKGEFGRTVVHGHTPVTEPQFMKNRINVDTGAYATGRLTCLRISEDGVSVLGCDG